MTRHWLISTIKGATIYNCVDFDPTGKPVGDIYPLADEIDGMTTSRAASVLRQMYERVTVFAQGGMQGKGCIICR